MIQEDITITTYLPTTTRVYQRRHEFCFESLSITPNLHFLASEAQFLGYHMEGQREVRSILRQGESEEAELREV
jgi:hypothetical protein